MARLDNTVALGGLKDKINSKSDPECQESVSAEAQLSALDFGANGRACTIKL